MRAAFDVEGNGDDSCVISLEEERFGDAEVLGRQVFDVTEADVNVYSAYGWAARCFYSGSKYFAQMRNL